MSVLRQELGLDLLPVTMGEVRELVRMPSRELARAERIEALKEKSAEVEYYVWLGIGLLVLVALGGALFGRHR